MGEDCGRGNEQLGAKALAVNNAAEGEVGGPKIPLNLPAWISLSNATNLSSGIFQIRRYCTWQYYVTSFQRDGLRNPRPLEFCGMHVFMNENST